MDDFKKLEAKFERTPVKLLDYEDATGVLHLQGHDSILHFSTAEEFAPHGVDENGWFSLRLRASDGHEILIHHAVRTGSTQHGWKEGKYHTIDIFPNVVISNSRGVSKTRSIRRISFRLNKLSQFFYYHHAETLRAHDLTEEQKALLEGLRYNHDWGPFLPDDIYIVHNYPEFFRFKVGNRAYSVWAGGTRTAASVSTLNAVVYPVPTIEFDEPVDIQEALDRIWEWRRFFNQLAQSELEFESVWLQGPGDDRSPIGNVYLPNLPNVQRRNTRQRRPHEVSVYNLPLSQWEEREQLGEVMRKWLELGEERRVFRTRLGGVIADMTERVDASDIIELSSGIEALDELGGKKSFPPNLVGEMAKAAAEKAKAAKIEISIERLGGVLGSLQRPSLALRLRELSRRVSPEVSEADADTLAKSVAKIRNTSAHGASLEAQIQPLVSPTIAALAALCGRFDLETAGMPSRASNGARSWPLQQFEEAMKFLRKVQYPS